jgi:hypothetical protein
MYPTEKLVKVLDGIRAKFPASCEEIVQKRARRVRRKVYLRRRYRTREGSPFRWCGWHPIVHCFPKSNGPSERISEVNVFRDSHLLLKGRAISSLELDGPSGRLIIEPIPEHDDLQSVRKEGQPESLYQTILIRFQYRAR